MTDQITRKVSVFIAAMLFSVGAMAYEFSWDNLMLSDAKLNSDYDYEAYVDAYMMRYRRPIWKKYKNDEFELEGKRQETIEMMKKRFAAFDLNQDFVINTGFKFGKYDFKKESFPLDGISANSYFYESKGWYGENVFPSRYSVHFTNPEIMDVLPMKKDDAKAFIQGKKNEYGRVDRRLPARIKFKILKKRGQSEFDAKITEITVYDKNKSAVLVVFD